MRTLRRVLPLGSSDRRAGRGLFLIVLAIYTATFSGLPDNPDAEVDFQTVSALVRNGSFGLGGTPEADALIAAQHNVRPRPARGDWVGRYGVGSALLSVPFYLTGRALTLAAPGVAERHAERSFYGASRSEYWEHLLVGWRNPLFGAAAVWMMFLAACRLGVGWRSALASAFGLAFATYLWPQARSSLSDVPATFFVTWAVERLFALRASLARGEPSTKSAALLGFALVTALSIRVATLPLVLTIGVAGAVCLASYRRGRIERRRKVRMAFALPFLVGFAALAVLNRLRFGSFFASGYEDVVGSGTWWSRDPLAGLAGLLISPGRGLIWMAPAVLFVPFALRAARRLRERMLPRVLALGCVGTLALAAAVGGWHGGHSYGPRYLLPAVPLAFLGVALVLDTRRAAFVRSAWRASFGLGVLVACPAVFVDAATHHDLALAAAEIEWPDLPGNPETAALARFERTLWDLRFAAPWAHWRILRHKLAVGDDVFGTREIFFMAVDQELEPVHARSLGFRHLGWVDLADLSGHPLWGIWALLACLGGAGAVLLARSSDTFGE